MSKFTSIVLKKYYMILVVVPFVLQYILGCVRFVVCQRLYKNSQVGTRSQSVVPSTFPHKFGVKNLLNWSSPSRSSSRFTGFSVPEASEAIDSGGGVITRAGVLAPACRRSTSKDEVRVGGVGELVHTVTVPPWLPAANMNGEAAGFHAIHVRSESDP